MIQTGYTKHYYAGTERLATVIGGGGFSDIITPIETLSSQKVDDIVNPFYTHYEHHTYDPFYYEDALNSDVVTEDVVGTQQQALPYQCQPIALESIEALAANDILINAIYDNEQVNNIETEIYYYHGDHLGSANWITDGLGKPIQYIHYAPYGELIANQMAYKYDERYKFTGNERDWETGCDYFGARYWWLAGTWLSVDPLSDKYPQISPYAYCNWNPVKFVDPDGREIINKVSPSDKTRYDAGNNIIDLKDNHIFFVSHGSPTAMYPHGQGEMNAEGFVNYLKENSKVWQKTQVKFINQNAYISSASYKTEIPCFILQDNLPPFFTLKDTRLKVITPEMKDVMIKAKITNVAFKPIYGVSSLDEYYLLQKEGKLLPED